MFLDCNDFTAKPFLHPIDLFAGGDYLNLLEIHIPELVKVIEAFTANRIKALEAFTNELRGSVSRTIDQILNAEIELFLGRPDQGDNKRNGSHPEREYAFKGIGCVKIRLPKDRKGRFDSQVIPSYERSDPRLKADMAVLHLAGLSTRMLAMISKRLLGIEVAKDTVSGSLDLVKDEAMKWLTSPIDKRFWVLYIDGTNFKIQRRGSTEREPSLAIKNVF